MKSFLSGENNKLSEIATKEFNLPSAEDIKKHFGIKSDGFDLTQAEFNITDASLQQYFIKDFNIHLSLEIEEKDSFAKVKETIAYRTLSRNFYEIVKNAIDANATKLKISVIRDSNNMLEIILSDNGKGFKKEGKFQALADGDPVDYNDIKKSNLDSDTANTKRSMGSDKEKGKALGGAGKGLSNMSDSLLEHGGKLLIQSTSDYPAVVRLVSSMSPVEERLSTLSNKVSKGLSSISKIMSGLTLGTNRTEIENEEPEESEIEIIETHEIKINTNTNAISSPTVVDSQNKTPSPNSFPDTSPAVEKTPKHKS